MNARRRLLVARIVALVLAVAVVVVAAAAWETYDPNHDKAVGTVRDAGIPASATPGPGGTR